MMLMHNIGTENLYVRNRWGINMQDIKKYAKIGLVHHLLYPECTKDRDYHINTLSDFVLREDIEALDCCIPYGEPYRNSGIIPKVRDCGKDVAYALHLFPARKISLSSLDIQEQEISKIVIKDQIDVAAKIGANGFVFVSGADVPYNRDGARKAFKEFCIWFCAELKKHNMEALLEPFDRTIDKKFLYGPVVDCVRLMDDLHQEGITNIGIELDMAHLPLMFEDFESSIERCAPYLKRVHLGNCVLKDKKHPFYGDMHPPIGLEGGEIDTPELKIILKKLLEVGYLDNKDRKPLILEMQPFPGKTVEYTIEESFRRLNDAWNMI